jgi:uridine kinase
MRRQLARAAGGRTGPASREPGMLSFDEVIAFVASRQGLRLIAIDGLPVAGKSTLAGLLAESTGGAVVQLDEFVKPEAAWRWRDRPSFPFDYIRYDEFLGAVIRLAADGSCRYRPYDWATGGLGNVERVVCAEALVMVEGVSALHPDLAPLYDLRIWVESDAATALEAVRARGMGSWAREWERMFLPSVELYLRTDPTARADVLAAGRGISGRT